MLTHIYAYIRESNQDAFELSLCASRLQNQLRVPRHPPAAPLRTVLIECVGMWCGCIHVSCVRSRVHTDR